MARPQPGHRELTRSGSPPCEISHRNYLSFMSNPTEIIVLGAKGRMGQMVLSACAKTLREKPGSLKVIAAVEYKGCPGASGTLTVDGLEVPFTDDLESVVKPGSVLIDFTTLESSLQALEIAERKGAAHVLCTTGFTPEQKARIGAAAQKIPVLFSPNMSIGVNVLFKATEAVARALGPDFDVEIIEAHHNQKKDSPSGTALGFAEAVARGHAVKLEDKAVYGREGMVGARPRGEIGIHAVRGGDIAGDHTVLFAGDGERIEIRHVAHGRQVFAQGALRAALFLQGRKPGLYTMADVLSL
jgi:4-hydroxy-tetrahydrodipicolinate reductase